MSNKKGIEARGNNFYLNDTMVGGNGGGEPVPDMSAYGYFGVNYPKQMAMVQGLLHPDNDKTSLPRLRFVHISDSHADVYSWGKADDLLANSHADFLVHTGDFASDQFNDSSAQAAITKMIGIHTATEKPVYFCIGNHDVMQASGATPLTNADVFNAYFKEALTDDADGFDGQGKTYYSSTVGNASSGYIKGYKLIFLDQYDGTTATRTADNGKVSETQIRWFINQLNDATTKMLHVIIFVHSQPGRVMTGAVPNWCDFQGHPYSDGGNEPFKKLVQAWIEKDWTNKPTDPNNGSYDFEYDGVTYEGRFVYNASTVSMPRFIGWFCGHTHYDSVGWLEGYPMQMVVAVTVPNARKNNSYCGMLNPDLEPTINYVCIDGHRQTCTVMRMGCQDNIDGIARDIFCYKFCNDKR